ncbi:MAG TPA: PepSY-associated TM helix domain-containing protein [Sphingobium sp.]|nr:PepSY-associated TM helix domain-containing protein [Sphingobium sp.]
MDARLLNAGLQKDDAGAAVRAARSARGEPAQASGGRASRKRRSWWLKQLHSWHWISAAVSLVGMMLFAVTGITLNHAGSISATPRVTESAAVLPPPLLARLKGEDAAPLPDAVASHLRSSLDMDVRGLPAEWSDEDVYVAMPGPGRDAWVSIDRASGAVTAEKTDRGWVSYLNDLHKGRNAGSAWFWFIDIFAVACVVFTLTGLVLLQMHARHRPSTWPIVGLGLAIPVILAIFFIH